MKKFLILLLMLSISLMAQNTFRMPTIFSSDVWFEQGFDVTSDLILENDEMIVNEVDGDLDLRFNDDATTLGQLFIESSIDSPYVADDDIFEINFTANDDSSTLTDWVTMQAKILDASDESEDSHVSFSVWVAGTETTTLTVTDVLTFQNGATFDNATNNTFEWNENSDEFIWTFGSNTITASSGDVTTFDYGTINLATDALDLSEGDISNVGTITLDGLSADGTYITVNDPSYHVADDDTVKITPYQEALMLDMEVDDARIAAIDTTGLCMFPAINYLADTTTVTDTYGGTITPAPAALKTGMFVIMVPGSDNSGASTLAFNGLTSKNIKTQTGVDPAAADIDATGVAMLVYNGTQWVLLNPATTTD